MALFAKKVSRLVGILIAVFSVALVTAVLVILRPVTNATTVAMIELLVVVLVATFFQRSAALAASILAALSFNYFFLPPFYTLTVSDPENWLALLVFLAVAVTVGHLSAISNGRRIEAESLYRQLEAAFETASQTEALKRSERLKSSLLDAVTHDFRTPLTSIKASVTMLIENEQLPREERALDQHGRGELLEVINEESDRLNSFVDSMVELARFQSGEIKLNRASVTPEEVVIKAARRASTLRREHSLRSRVEADLPMVSIDSRTVVEALFNLIENAANYSPPGTEIEIAAIKAKGTVRFSVEDEGPGVPADEREKVFERYFRGQTADHRGMGMGLSIVRGIIEAHGGQIWVEEGRRGARFVFELPARGDG